MNNKYGVRKQPLACALRCGHWHVHRYDSVWHGYCLNHYYVLRSSCCILLVTEYASLLLRIIPASLTPKAPNGYRTFLLTYRSAYTLTLLLLFFVCACYAAACRGP